LADLHGPNAGPIDRKQQVIMRLQVMRARVRRAGQEVYRLGIFGIADVDHGDAVGKPVTDIGEAAIDHHLHAVAATALVAMVDIFHIPVGDSSHGQHLPRHSIVNVMAGLVPAISLRRALPTTSGCPRQARA